MAATRRVLTVSLVVIASCLSLAGLLGPSPTLAKAESPTGAQSLGDGDLFLTVVDRVHAGEPYYDVMGQELHRRGYPTTPPMTWRLPTLSVFQALWPGAIWRSAVLVLLALVTAVLWFRRVSRWSLDHALPVLIGLGGMVPAFANPIAAVMHDPWAGLLIALSLVLRANGHTWASLGVAGMAVAVRELALPFVIVMAAVAAFERRRGEAAAWVLLTVTCALGLWLHYSHVSTLVAADALKTEWVAGGGWAFVQRAARAHPLLLIVPEWVTSLVLPWVLIGYWWLPERRVVATVAAYVSLFLVAGRPDNWYWGLLVAPLLPLGAVGWTIALLPSRQRGRSGD
jgi:hypothetical protein